MQLAKPLKRNPRELAQALVDALGAPARGAALGRGDRDRRPGLHQPAPQGRRPSRRWWPRCWPPAMRFGSAAATAARAGDGRIRLGQPDRPAARRPRPPGRARRRDLQPARMRRAGDVTREFYYNDAGVQIATLAASVQARAEGPQAGRRAAGRSRPTTATTSPTSRPTSWRARPCTPTTASSPRRATPTTWTASASSPSPTCATSRTWTCRRFGVRFDNYYLESSLYTSGRVDDTVRAAGRRRQDLRGGRRAVAAHHRLRRRQGPRDAQVATAATPTSCPTWPTTSPSASAASRKVINIQGTDHHGTIARVRAGLQAAGVGVPGRATPTTCCTRW